MGDCQRCGRTVPITPPRPKRGDRASPQDNRPPLSDLKLHYFFRSLQYSVTLRIRGRVESSGRETITAHCSLNTQVQEMGVHRRSTVPVSFFSRRQPPPLLPLGGELRE